jgi:hypothetical protein
MFSIDGPKAGAAHLVLNAWTHSYAYNPRLCFLYGVDEDKQIV